MANKKTQQKDPASFTGKETPLKAHWSDGVLGTGCLIIILFFVAIILLVVWFWGSILIGQ
jgi:hypothetical protein